MEGAMRLQSFHSLVLSSFGIVAFLGCYALFIWLIGGFLSFAKQAPDAKRKALVPGKR